MPKDNFTPRSTFTRQQVLAANGDLEQAIARLEKATIGSHYNPRQRDIMLVAYENYEAEKEGRFVEKMALGEYEQDLAEDFDVDQQTIKKDIKDMGWIMEKIPMEGSNQKFVHWMSDEGAEKYRAFEQGKAALIVQAYEKIKAAGEVPSMWQRFIASFTAALTAFFVISTPNDVQANGNVAYESFMGNNNGHMGTYIPVEPSYDQAAIFRSWDGGFAIDINPQIGANPEPEGDLSPNQLFPLLEIVDRSSFFDKHRPKMLY